ncbi:MAG: DMT family transporter [candidate division Zixibacteria bacterium]|nr:DMT family transporter [candidate division Zixibacteria bacterium]
MSIHTVKRNSILADLGLLYAAAIWGATFFIVKSTLDDIDPVVLVGYRFLIAGLGLLVYVWLSGRRLIADLKQAIVLGVLLWILYIPQTMGLQYTTASNSGFITGLFVAFVPVFLLTIFRRRPTVPELIASLLSLVGLWVLTGGLVDINIGDMLTVITAMAYALHLLYADKYMKGGIDPFVSACQQFIIVGVLSLLTGLLFDLPFGIASHRTMSMVIFLAVFPTLSAFVIQMVAQKIAKPLRVSLIFALEPVFAAMFAWTLGGEIFVLRRAIGGLLIFAALVVSGMRPPGVARAGKSRSNQDRRS